MADHTNAAAHKPLYKRPWFLISATLLIIVAMAAISGGDDDEEDRTDDTATEAAADAEKAAESEEPANAAPSIGLGDGFTLGDYAFTVHTVTSESAVGNEYVRETAPSGSTYLVVSYSIRNDGKESETIAGDDLALRDAKDRTFEPDSKASTALSMSSGSSQDIIAELQPGVPVTKTAVFLVPDDAIAAPFVLVANEPGLGGGDVEIGVAPTDVK